MKLRTKFFIHILLSVTFLFAISFFFLTERYIRQGKGYALKTTELYTDLLSSEVKDKLDGYMIVVKNMADILQYHINASHTLNDTFVMPILKAELENNQDFLAVWLSVELKFLNKNWIQSSGRRRIILYWQDGLMKLSVDTLDVEKQNQNSAYYKMKVGEYSTLIMDPYFYTYTTKDTVSSYWETSLGVPLHYDNSFIGLVGIDVDLTVLRNLINVVTPFKDSYTFLLSTSGDIVAHPKYEALAKKITVFYPELKKYNGYDKIKAGKKFHIIYKANDGKWYIFSFSPVVVADKKLPWSLAYVVPLSSVMENIKAILVYAIVIPIIAILILAVLVYIFLGIISRRITKAEETLTYLSKGIIKEDLKLEVRTNDELGRMSDTINKLIDSLLDTVKFAQEIGKGNLDAYYKLKSDEDILGKALIEMKNNLKRVRKEEQERLKEVEHYNWVQKGITQVNEILRKYNDNLEELSFEVIKQLVKYSEAVQGGVYLIVEKEAKQTTEESNRIIKLIAAYAYDRKKQLEAEFELGEGLVGRAIKEENTIKITNLPQGYVFVKSGLGDDTPKNLLIVPLIFEQEVIGAIEILSFKEFDKYKEEFITQASYRIASSMSNLMKNLQTVKLLEEFKKQNAKIRQKEQALEERLKELEKQRNEVELMKQKFEKFYENLGLTFSVLTYNSNFYLTQVNDKFLTLTQIKAYEVLGKHINDILPEAKQSPQWYEKFIEDLSHGIVRKKETRYEFGKNIVYFDETYIPILNKNGKVIEFIVIGYDITHIKIKKEKK